MSTAHGIPGFLQRSRYTILLLALVAFLALQPVLAGRGMLIDGVVTLLLLASMWASGGRNWRRGLRIILGIAVLLILWGRNATDSKALALSEYVLWTAFHAFVCASLLFMVLRSSMVTPDVVAGGVAGYILVGITWCGPYAALELISPGSFGGLADAGPGGDALLGSGADDRETLLKFFYFSFTTLTTLGYGDILPVSGFARSLAVLEAITGVMFTAILISALMSRYVSFAITHPKEAEEQFREHDDEDEEDGDPSESAGGDDP